MTSKRQSYVLNPVNLVKNKVLIIYTEEKVQVLKDSRA